MDVQDLAQCPVRGSDIGVPPWDASSRPPSFCSLDGYKPLDLRGRREGESGVYIRDDSQMSDKDVHHLLARRGTGDLITYSLDAGPLAKFLAFSTTQIEAHLAR